MKIRSPRTALFAAPADALSNANERGLTKIETWSGRGTFVWFDEIKGFDGVFGPRTEGKVELLVEPSRPFVARLQHTVGARVDGIVGYETVTRFRDLFEIDEETYTLKQFRDDLKVFEEGGPFPERLLRYAATLQRQDFIASVDAVERIASELEAMSRES